MKAPHRDTRGTLVVLDGGLPSLVALRLAALRSSGSSVSRTADEPGTGAVVGYVPRAVVMEDAGGGDGTAGGKAARRTAAREAARLCGCRLIEARPATLGASIVRTEPESDGTFADWWNSGRHATSLLVESLGVAAGMGTEDRWGEIVWPVQIPPEAGHSLDRIAAALDRAMLLGQVDSVDAEDEGATVGSARRTGEGVTIRTPLIDLRDEQVVELALDLELPLRAMAEGRIPMACVWDQRWVNAYRRLTGIACERKPEGDVRVVATPDLLDRPHVGGASHGNASDEF